MPIARTKVSAGPFPWSIQRGPDLGNVPADNAYIRLKQNFDAVYRTFEGLHAAGQGQMLSSIQLQQTRDELQATGQFPINLTGLLPQSAAVVFTGTRAVRLARYQAGNYAPGTLFYESDTALMYEIQMLGGARTWVAIQPLVSPLAFGGKGDGTTDDSSAISRALTACGYLWLPKGYTFISGKVTITSPNTLVWGGGTLKAKTNLNDDLLYLDGSANASGSYFRVEDVILDGNQANQSGGTGSCVRLRNAAYSWLCRCVVQNAKGDNAVLENFNSSTVADEVNVIDNRIFSGLGHGLRFLRSGTSTAAPGDCLVKDNHINYNGGNGIFGGIVFATIFSGNNVLTNALNGIKITASIRNVYAENQCRNNGGSGIYLDEDAGWGVGEDNLLLGNQCHYNNGTAGSSNNYDIWNSNRTMLGTNYGGDLNFTPRCPYGIQLFNAIDTRLVGNDFSNNATGNYLIGGTTTYTAFGNYGLSDTSVTSLNGLQGAVTLAAGNNITVTPDGNNNQIIIAATGGGGIQALVAGAGIVISGNNTSTTVATNLVAGANITLTPGAGNNITIAATGGNANAGITSVNALTGPALTIAANNNNDTQVVAAGNNITINAADQWNNTTVAVAASNDNGPSPATAACRWVRRGKTIHVEIYWYGTIAAVSQEFKFGVPANFNGNITYQTVACWVNTAANNGAILPSSAICVPGFPDLIWIRGTANYPANNTILAVLGGSYESS